MPALSDLSTIQIRAMIKLDTPGGELDSVGRRIEELSPPILAAVFDLIELGLATSELGWGNTAWFRLTPKGRAVREFGEA
ncbi:hypothetical protein [Aureimonas ureilytica]|uniref:hypothetical protein n=1 Tax=Aureimonas ureilytica TaxID=401562 RepID=UPI000369E052|nr:hypothetical protein [Aureimonas ureilytica]